jgi:Ca-activated chloride channel family protein
MPALILTLALLLQAPSLPQPAPTPTPGELALSVDVNLVNVLFTVSDRKGRLVTSLPMEKFRVFDDNKKQVITHFSSETEMPLNIALLIDASGSIENKVDFEQEAAIKFLSSVLRERIDRALLMTFDLRVNLLQDYTDDVAKLARAAEKIRVGGGTPLYDAVYLAATEKLARQPGRRIEIVISDGMDTTSRKSLAEALRAAQQNDTTIYCISTNSIRKEYMGSDSGNRIMRKLAEETGGRAFFPSKTKDLDTAFKKLNEELGGQYTLAYGPSETLQDGAFHRIRIETDDRRLRIQARNGYFAGRRDGQH